MHHLPPTFKHLTTDIIAALVCWPLARLSGVLEKLHFPIHGMLLSFYRNHTFYTLRSDACDRFGTPLKQCFTRGQIESMLLKSGLVDMQFSKADPYWCVVGLKD